MSINTDFIKILYPKYIDNIKLIRKQMMNRMSSKSMSPQFDDTESEITALLMLHFKPKNVIEFSPYTGWSTNIILDTLNINNNNAHLSSYDIHDKCLQNVKKIPQNVNWKFTKIDVKNKYKEFVNGDKIDYLFIDSDHSENFATNYVNNLLIPLLEKCRLENTKIIVSVHDVFHFSKKPSKEGEIVIKFLNTNNISYYTANCLTDAYKEIMVTKINLGIDKIILKSWGNTLLKDQSNSCIFFILS